MSTNRRLRPPLIVIALLSLIGALWGGLLRIGWSWPTPETSLAIMHGPLMICGVLGTVIGLERAVALDRRWGYLAPLCSGLGAALLIIGAPVALGALLMTIGSALVLAIFGVLARRQPALFTTMLAIGALLWLIGNLLWLAGLPVFRVVLWWAAFLVLTIAGERLELSRLIRLSARARQLFLLIVGVLIVGAAWATADLVMGGRVTGAGYIALALWLLRYDLARRTVRKTGLTRFIAVCLLGGYVWLGIGGVIGLIYGGIPAGPIYDALLHTVFVGFVFAMIFGHAPIIIPAVLRIRIDFRRVFYAHLALLHVSLALRILGDLMGSFGVRRWGGLLNALAMVLFVVITVFSALRSRYAAAPVAGKPAATSR